MNMLKPFLLLILCLLACACRNPQAAQRREPSPDRATVAIMCQHIETQIGFDSAADRVAVQVPCCSGFALRTATGFELLTAAHCVPGPTAVYVPSKLWADTAYGGRLARVGSRTGDVVTLLPSPEDDGLDAAALLRGPDATRGDFVRAVRLTSSLSGQVVTEQGETNLDVAPGWSGAPVVDSEGRAVGMVIACMPGVLGVGCAPRTGYYTALPQ